jgi:biopolymer transport protein ExbD
MRIAKTRMSDSTFEINLAPFLDIIVSVVPLLLLSVVFVEIKMIDTPVPQVVQNAIDKNEKDKDPEVTLSLKVEKTKGFTLTVNRKGATDNYAIPIKDGTFDYATLGQKAAEVKTKFPQVFRLGLSPEGNVPFNDLVQAMDVLRKLPNAVQKVAFTDTTSGQRVETDMMFPNVTFNNIVGD